MNTIQARRSIRLATKILPKIPKKKFDITIFGEEKKDCGTVACVAGWAALDREFQKEGCSYDRPEFNGQPNFGDYGEGVSGAADFFGLSDFTFLPEGYPENAATPTAARKRVESEIVCAGYGDWLKLAKKASRDKIAKRIEKGKKK